MWGGMLGVWTDVEGVASSGRGRWRTIAQLASACVGGCDLWCSVSTVGLLSSYSFVSYLFYCREQRALGPILVTCSVVSCLLLGLSMLNAASSVFFGVVHVHAVATARPH